MSRAVSTVVLFLVLAGLVGYLRYLGRTQPSAESAKEKPFGELKANDVEELQVTAQGETTHLKKTDAGWSIVEPVQADADAGEVTSMAGNLASFEVSRVVDEKPADLKAFGLEPPRTDVRFKT